MGILPMQKRLEPLTRRLHGRDAHATEIRLSTESTDTLDLPPVPRPITSRAKRRSWAEAPVRTWVILALIVCGVTAYLYAQRARSAMNDRRLVMQGVPIKAKVNTVEENPRPGHSVVRRDGPLVNITYTAPDGSTQNDSARLTPLMEGSVETGGQLDIRVDPENPRRWTDRTKPRPWSAELSVPLLLTPFAFMSLLVLVIRRQAVLKVWETGEPVMASVTGSQQSAIAPRSRQLSYVLQTGGRVHTMLYPLSAGMLDEGDEVLMIAPPNEPGRAIAAKLYV